MESVRHSAVTPQKSRLARAINKVLHVRALTGVLPDDGIKKSVSHEKTRKDPDKKNAKNLDDDLLMKEAFLAKLFASLSSTKAAYAQLQFSQCPYDGEGIQSADQAIISELKSLSELKQCYLKQKALECCPRDSLVMSEILEQKSLIKTYQITAKKLDSELKLKDSEITFLKEKLADVNSDNRLLEKRLNTSRHLATPTCTRLSDLKTSHFVAYFRQAVKSIRSFVRYLVNEMESAGWDLEAAANSIEPGISFWRSNHVCFAFESFLCRQMFDGFHGSNIEPSSDEQRQQFFNRFMELKSVKSADYLAWKPKSRFAAFCRQKYLKLVHPKMELNLFNNLVQRKLVSSGEFPDTPFFFAFTEMAKRVWLLHCLASSLDQEVCIFKVKDGSRFSEVYMESLSDEAFFDDANRESDPRVAFVVVPGFMIDRSTVVQCQVYLC